MDRTQYLLPALVAGVMCAAQLGCGRDSSGEYRTYAEIESVQRSADVPEPAVSALASSGASASPAELTDTAQLPIDPELTPEIESNGGASDVSPDVVAAGALSPASDVEAAQYSQAASSIETSDSIASLGADRSGLIEPAPSDPISEGAVVDLSTFQIEQRQIELLVPDKSFKTEGRENALRVSYDDLDLLKVLNMEPVPDDAASYFPKWLSDLNGERIRIRGFMYPTFEATGITRFVLARDNQICCFGRSPKIYDLIEVAMRKSVTTDYILGRPFDVVGVFQFNPEWNADVDDLVPLYQIDDAIVIDK